MRKTFSLIFVSTILMFALIGCSAVNVEPVLNSSLSMAAFDKMKKIEQHNVKLALYIEPKIKELQLNQNLRLGRYTFDIGNAFSAKLIKALSYSFKNLYFLDTPEYAENDFADAIMYVNLQDIDADFKTRSGFSNVYAESYVRFSIRAEIKDVGEKKTVWVGTTQAKTTESHQEYGSMAYQEAGRGYAAAIDNAIDNAIGDLINDMSKSQNLSMYLEKWEQRNKGEN